MKFTLSLPPSINQTYGVNRVTPNPMFKRKGAKNWEHLAGQEIMIQTSGNRKVFEGPVKMGITFYYKIDRDIDAGLKILLDLFQKQNVYTNDRQVRKIMYIDIFEDKENPRVEVEIYELT